MRFLDLFRPGAAALTMPRSSESAAVTEAVRIASEREMEGRVHARLKAMADADTNTFWHVDPVSNPNTGLLGPQDALSGTIPTAYGWFLNDFQLAQLYALQIARTICSEQPAWLAAAGHRISTEDGDDQLSGLDDAYGLSNAFADANTRANHLRGAGILIDCDEDGDPPLSEPLDPRKVRRINKLVVYGGLLLQVAEWQNDPEDSEGLPPLWRKFAGPARPKQFRLLPTFRQGGIPLDRGGGSGTIHWTRILYFQGAAVPPDVDGMLACPSTHYCLSKLDLCWRSIRRWMTTASNAERIANNHGAWWMTIGNKGALDTAAALNPGSGGLGWVDRMISFFNARKVFVGMPEDKIGNVGIDLGGWDKIEQGAYVDLANTSLIPVPLLFESLPAGFSQANDTWEPQWHGRLNTAFRTQWAANLLRFYALAFYVKNQRAPRMLKVDPGPWREPTDEQRQKVRNDKATELTALLAANVITRAEARTCYHPTFTVDMRTEAPDEGASVQPTADAAEAVWIGLEVDPAAMAPLWAALPLSVRRDPWPHLMLCYLGTVRSSALPDVLAAAAAHASRAPTSVTPIEVGPLGDGGAQVVFVKRGGIDALERSLFRAVAPAITAEQYPRFIPHVTIGYGEGAVNAALPGSLPIKALVVRQGEREIGRFAVA